MNATGAAAGAAGAGAGVGGASGAGSWANTPKDPATGIAKARAPARRLVLVDLKIRMIIYSVIRVWRLIRALCLFADVVVRVGSVVFQWEQPVGVWASGRLRLPGQAEVPQAHRFEPRRFHWSERSNPCRW